MKNYSLLTALIIMGLLSFSFTGGGKVKGKSKGKKAASIAAVSRSLAFPVSGKKSKIGSFWGAVRGGGTRSHKGIDIFAKKGTPVVAISDGVIVGKDVERLGGKILWLKSEDHPISAYYAHLDQWKVKEGQHVRKGQVLGTVGNTGNARTTPSHLHFGIYKPHRVAVNPLPYVKKATKITAPKTVVKHHTASKKHSKKAIKRNSSRKHRSRR